MSMRSAYPPAPPIRARFYNLPLLGYWLRIAVAVAKLPQQRFHLSRLDREAAEDRERARIQRDWVARLEREAGEDRQRGTLQFNRLAEQLARLDREAIEDRGRFHAQVERLAPLEREAREDRQRFIDLAGRADAQFARLDAAAANLSHQVMVLSEAFPRLVEAASASQTALRMLRREQVAQTQSAGETGLAGDPWRWWIDPQIDIVPERQLRRTPPTSLNRMPRLADWSADGPLSKRMTSLAQPHLIHRKMWEYAICLEGLTQLGVVTPEAVGLAVGAGAEPPIYYFANQVRRMVATDLYHDGWTEAPSAMLAAPASHAPFAYREDRLEVLAMSGDALSFAADHFDFVFCLSSIEHFGSRQAQAAAFAEMGRVVKPGGVVCIVTELILNGEQHPEFFTPAELSEMFLRHHALRLVGGLDLQLSDALPPLAVDVRVAADAAVSPHLLLTDGRVLWTSVSLFFRHL